MSPLVFDAEAKETFAVTFCISDELVKPLIQGKLVHSLHKNMHKLSTCQGKLAGVQQALIRCEDSRALIASLVRQF